MRNRSLRASLLSASMLVLSSCPEGGQAGTDLGDTGQDMAVTTPDLSGGGGTVDMAKGGAEPLLFAVMPRLASTAGNVDVTITGANFVAGAALKVEFGGVAATSVQLVDGNKLTAKLPANPGKLGAVAVTVTNGDGKPVTVNDPLVFAYYLAAPDFGAPTATATCAGPRSIAVADFDTDQKLDFAVACADANQVGVVFGAQNGTFSGKKTFTVGMYPFSIATGDLDGDGSPDLATANQKSNTVTALFNANKGDFSTMKSLTVGAKPQGVSIGDVAGDPLPDIAVGNYDGPSFTLLTNQGSMNFGTATTTLPYKPYALFLADVGGDTNLDIASVSDVGNKFVYATGDGKGVFATAKSLDVGSTPLSGAFVELNNDGYPEIIAGLTAGKLAILKGSSGQVFDPPAADVTVGTRPEYIASADLDGDRNMDLVVANLMSGTVPRNSSVAHGAPDAPRDGTRNTPQRRDADPRDALRRTAPTGSARLTSQRLTAQLAFS